MKNNILKSVFFGILAFWVPVLILLFAFKHLRSLLQIIAEPIKRLFPNNGFFEIFVDIILFALVFFIFSYLIGLITQKTVLKKWAKKIDNLLARIFPSYVFDKNFFIGKDVDSEGKWKTVILEDDEVHKIGILVEEHPDGLCVVFIPGAPSAANGEIVLLRKERLLFLSISVQEVVKLMRQYGAGFSDLYEKGLLMPKK